MPVARQLRVLYGIFVASAVTDETEVLWKDTSKLYQFK